MNAGAWTSITVGAIFGWVWAMIAIDAGAGGGWAALIGLAGGIVTTLVTAAIWILLQGPPGS
jgi:hypothetical protein